MSDKTKQIFIKSVAAVLITGIICTHDKSIAINIDINKNAQNAIEFAILVAFFTYTSASIIDAYKERLRH